MNKMEKSNLNCTMVKFEINQVTRCIIQTEMFKLLEMNKNASACL